MKSLSLVFILCLAWSMATVACTAITCTTSSGTSHSLPPSFINDNYCDCVETGEDELTTAACAHVNSRYFTCLKDFNKNISYTFVKDKVCDCCDGSDETTGFCPDTCQQQLEKEIKKIQKEIDLHLKGEAVKKGYMKQGVQGVKQLDATTKALRQEVKVEEEEFQAKMHSQMADQQTLRQLYARVMQKKQHLEIMQKLTSSSSSFGSKKEFFPLFGKCYAKQSNEKEFKGGSFEPVAKDFLFEICPFERITQVGTAKDDTPTLLGVWHGWDTTGDTIAMKYTGGAECWNGPERVVRVHMTCGEDDKLVEVRENGKCTYEFVFSSPAACSKKHADKLKKYLKKISPKPDEPITHDEL